MNPKQNYIEQIKDFLSKTAKNAVNTPIPVPFTNNLAKVSPAQIGNTAADILLRAPSRAVEEARMSLQGKQEAYTPQGGIEQAIFGNQPLRNYNDPQRTSRTALKSVGVSDENANKIAPFLIGGGVLADVLPGGKGKKEGVELAEKEVAPAAGQIVKKAPGFIENLKRSINQTNKVQLPADINAPEREMDLQTVLNTEVPGNTLGEKYKNLQPTLNRLEQEIQTKLTEGSTNIPISDIRTALQARVQPLVDAGTIPARKAIQEVEGYLARMYASATKQSGFPAIENTMDAKGNITPFGSMKMPDKIPDSLLFQIKQIGNKATKGLFDKEHLSPTEQVTMALRNGVDQVLTGYRPDIKELTNKQSLLFDAVDPLSKMRDTDRSFSVGLPLKIGNIPLSVGVGNKIGGTLRDIAGSALNKNPVTMAGVGAAGLLGGEKLLESNLPKQVIDTLADKAGYRPNDTQSVPGNSSQYPPTDQSQNDMHSGNTIPSSYSDINTNDEGSYDIPTQPLGDANYMTDTDRRMQEQNLTPGTPEYNRIESNFQRSQDLAKNILGGQKMDFMQSAPRTINLGNTVRDDLSEIPSNIWNAVASSNGITDYLNKNKNSPYAKQLSNIENFNQQFSAAYQQLTGAQPGGDMLLSPGDDPKTTEERWNLMQKMLAGGYREYLNPYLTLTTTSGSQLVPGQPQAANYAPPPQQHDFSNIVGGELPPIPQMQVPQLPNIGQ